MDLPLTVDPPDTLGFAKVSGLYGSGTWAAWALTIAASWIHIIFHDCRGKKKLDLNLWVYLLGLNVAAFDLIRHTRHLRQLYDAKSEDEPWQQEAASVGAALIVVIWGSFQAHLQLLVGRLTPNFSRRLSLCLGLLLPSASTIITGHYLGSCSYSLKELQENFWTFLFAFRFEEDIVKDVPALYWRGMESRSRGLTFLPWCGFLWLTVLRAIPWSMVWVAADAVATIYIFITSSVHFLELRGFSLIREWLSQAFTSFFAFKSVT